MVGSSLNGNELNSLTIILCSIWWGFISQNYVVWLIFFLMNVYIALKGSHFWFLFAFIAAGIVQCDCRKTSPRTSTIVQFIFYFGPLRSARIFWQIRNKWFVKTHILDRFLFIWAPVTNICIKQIMHSFCVYNQSLTTASGSRLFGSVVRALDFWPRGPGFESR